MEEHRHSVQLTQPPRPPAGGISKGLTSKREGQGAHQQEGWARGSPAGGARGTPAVAVLQILLGSYSWLMNHSSKSVSEKHRFLFMVCDFGMKQPSVASLNRYTSELLNF